MGGKIYQLQATVAAGYGSFIMGLLNVWPSYTSSLLTSNSTTPLSAPLTQAQDSLLGSLPSLGAMIGTVTVGLIIDTLGRRNGGVTVSLPFVISWAVIAISKSPTMVLGARFLSGISGGAFLVFAPIFISEIADDSIRGALASAPIVMYCTGTLVSYLLGWLLTYHTIIWTNIVCCVVGILLLMSATESPVYLVRQKREEEARSAIAHYRGVCITSAAVSEEMTRIKQMVTPAVELLSINSELEIKEEETEKEKLNTEEVQPETLKKMSPLKLLFTSASSLRGFLVVICLMTMQIFMGMVPVQVYAKTVFTQADPTRSDLYTVIFAVVMLVGCLVTAGIADKAGRRILIIMSSALVTLCMATLGYLVQSKVAPAWVTVLTIMLYCFSFMAGAGSVPYVLLAEVFVPEVQGLASMIIIEWVWLLNFCAIAVFPIMNSVLGAHGVFYTFACCGLANVVISYCIVPETKGLSTQLIQDLFRGRKK